jgi:peptide/nickel transport system substrate-binding protein
MSKAMILRKPTVAIKMHAQKSMIKERKATFHRAVFFCVMANFFIQTNTIEKAFAQASQSTAQHGIAMHGEPKLPVDFRHWTYVNPKAPKGGKLSLAAQGTFDSLNPYTIRGVPAQGIQGYVIESLMSRNWDEPFSLYGLIAEKIETPKDRSYVRFYLNKAAKFSDGTPITTQDVAFTLNLLKEKGRPNHREYYKKVKNITIIDQHIIELALSKDADRELPLILGLMPVLPMHKTNAATFEETNLNPMIGSGPYTIKRIEAGKTLSLERDKNYWAKDLNVNLGRFNFDEITFEYFRDSNTMMEAFKAGLYDVRTEPDPVRWTTQYDFAAVKEGKVIKRTFPSGVPKPLNAFAFNTRRALFTDVKVREALLILFDGQWINKTLFHDIYQRSWGYFDGSELSSLGKPASNFEKELIKSFGQEVPSNIIEGTSFPPKTDGSGRDRKIIRAALKLLSEAGYEQRDGAIRDKNNVPMSFEILVVTREQERVSLAYSEALRKIGIEAKIRLVDTSQFEERRSKFDFDIIPIYFPGSLSPGNEQSFRWGSAAAKMNGSFNVTGIQSEGVDKMISAMLTAESREEFIDTARALDRLLMSNVLTIPLFHLPGSWVAMWENIQTPEHTPLFGYMIDTWWTNKSREER